MSIDKDDEKLCQLQQVHACHQNTLRHKFRTKILRMLTLLRNHLKEQELPPRIKHHPNPNQYLYVTN